MVRLKRVYDEPTQRDGLRILFERLWPRGVSKASAVVHLWLKDLAPSTELRKWYGHVPERWDEFRNRYWSELDQKGDLLTLLKHRTTEGNVTFVFAAGDTERNSAVALRDYLEQRLSGRGAPSYASPRTERFECFCFAVRTRLPAA